MTKNFNIEKITEYNYFLIITSFIFFIDSYSIIFMDISIININSEIIKSKIGLILVLFFAFSFYMAIITKVASFIINIIYKLKFQKEDTTTFNRDNYIYDDDLREIAIRDNNSVLYNYYLSEIKLKDDIFRTQYLSVGVICILIINYFSSSGINISLTNSFEIFFNSKWYFEILSIIPLLTIIYISYGILDRGYLSHIYLNKDIKEKLQEEKPKRN